MVQSGASRPGPGRRTAQPQTLPAPHLKASVGCQSSCSLESWAARRPHCSCLPQAGARMGLIVWRWEPAEPLKKMSGSDCPMTPSASADLILHEQMLSSDPFYTTLSLNQTKLTTLMRGPSLLSSPNFETCDALALMSRVVTGKLVKGPFNIKRI